MIAASFVLLVLFVAQILCSVEANSKLLDLPMELLKIIFAHVRESRPKYSISGGPSTVSHLFNEHLGSPFYFRETEELEKLASSNFQKDESCVTLYKSSNPSTIVVIH